MHPISIRACSVRLKDMFTIKVFKLVGNARMKEIRGLHQGRVPFPGLDVRFETEGTGHEIRLSNSKKLRSTKSKSTTPSIGSRMVFEENWKGTERTKVKPQGQW